MKVFAAITVLAASASAAQWGQSCVNEKLDAATDILSASCNTGDGKGTFADTSLDLNTCLGFSDKQIIFKLNGDYGKSCHECHIYRTQDPVYPGDHPVVMNCTCDGVTGEVVSKIDQTQILNKYGKLQCIY